ncbi:MAG: YfiR family protein [Cyclobacteriaceae bacterium]|nr:YfiR family protein [Cyclobacteriaceae bacterium]
MYRRNFYQSIIGVFLFCSLFSSQAQAQANIYKLHSLFLYNFTKHIQWQEVGNEFTIGVFGNDIALKEVKSNFDGKKFSGKDIKVINIAGVGDANSSQLVYFPKSNKGKILDLFESADKSNTLFVSEDDFIVNGMPIIFTVKADKLGFRVSKSNLDASGLKISSSLLSLAEVVD